MYLDESIIRHPYTRSRSNLNFRLSFYSLHSFNLHSNRVSSFVLNKRYSICAHMICNILIMKFTLFYFIFTAAFLLLVFSSYIYTICCHRTAIENRKDGKMQLQKWNVLWIFFFFVHLSFGRKSHSKLLIDKHIQNVLTYY